LLSLDPRSLRPLGSHVHPRHANGQLVQCADQPTAQARRGLPRTGRGPALPQLGMWFVVLAAITWVAAGVARLHSSALALTLGFVAGGATVAAVADIAALHVAGLVAGWLFVISALIGWYTPSGVLLEAMVGRPVLPLGTYLPVNVLPPMRSERAGEASP